jgi:predicted dehydrogenase
MEKTIGIGLIGLGMGRDLLYLNSDPDSRFQVRGVCTSTASKADAFAKENQIPFWTTDYHELIQNEYIDVIAVYTPDHLHAQQCIDALKAEKHVIVTKPMVTSLDDSIEIASLAKKMNLKFLVGETCRWYTSFLDLKKLYDDGELGDIILAEAHYVHEIKDFFNKTSWRLTAPQDFMYGGVCHR